VATRLDERHGRTAQHRLLSPRDRPPASIRAFAAVLGAVALLVNVTLLLSDRAPGLLERAFGDAARQLWDRIDAGARTGIPTDRVPENDFLVHVAIWAIAVVFVGLALWTWRGLAIGATVVFGCSVVLEAAQGRYSASRVVERADVLANAAGVVVGVATVAGCFLLWSAAAALARPRQTTTG